MNKNMSEYKDLIHLMEAAPKVPAPDHLTERVMGRLPEHDVGLLFKLKRALNEQVGNGFNFGWAGKSGAVSKTECSFYFFITGFFYLIMGIVVMIGLKKISSGVADIKWIELQPYLAIGTAIWLFALGIVVMLDGNTGIKAARYGTLFFIFFAVFNGILMRPYLHVPYTGMFIIGFVATSTSMGVILALAIQKMNLRPV